MKENDRFSKPIRPPRLPGCCKAPVPMPASFVPILRVATLETAARYGVDKSHIRKWTREWLKTRPSLRNYDMQEEKPRTKKQP